jgi:NADPH-dependent 2,4-dienoyl-CoA reductase/sulfur reductase-like enzyme
MRLVVIGGSDAGVSAALRAREVEPGAHVTMLLADDYPNFSICGLPYLIGGAVPDWRRLAHRTAFPGIDVRRRTLAEAIDISAKTVLARLGGDPLTIAYDRLVIATGAVPVRPDLPGAELPGVHVLHTMDDSFAVQASLAERAVTRVLIVGAGYIGLEMAEAFVDRGIEVTLLSRSDMVLPSVDPSLGARIGATIAERGVRLLTNVALDRIEPGLVAVDDAGTRHAADLILLATGVRPSTALAGRAGVRLGQTGAIEVTDRMETNITDVFAAGDCVETYHRLLPTPTWMSLGTTSHKQGRVAGENAVGGDRRFAGVLGTQSLKLFDMVVARTGLLDREARKAGFDPLTIETKCDDHKAYYPTAGKLHIRLTGDRRSGRLLGMQIVGPYRAEVSKRIDVVAAALWSGAPVDVLNDFDLSYTPPLSSPWDPIQQAAQAWVAAWLGRPH